MSVSTDCILVYGVELGDEKPAFLENFGDFDDYLNKLSGLPCFG